MPYYDEDDEMLEYDTPSSIGDSIKPEEIALGDFSGICSPEPASIYTPEDWDLDT